MGRGTSARSRRADRRFTSPSMKRRLCDWPGPLTVRVRAVYGAGTGHVAQTISEPIGSVRKTGRADDSIKVMTLPGPSRTIIVEPIEQPETAPAQPEREPDPAPDGAGPRAGRGSDPGARTARRSRPGARS